MFGVQGLTFKLAQTDITLTLPLFGGNLSPQMDAGVDVD